MESTRRTLLQGALATAAITGFAGAAEPQAPILRVIPSTGERVEYLRDNQAAGRGRLPDPAMRKRMEQHWDALA